LRINKTYEKADDIDEYVQLLEQSLEYVYKIRNAKSSLIELKHKNFLKNPLIGYIIAAITLVVMIILYFL